VKPAAFPLDAPSTVEAGFCAPGFVVPVRAFLAGNPTPTDEEIAHVRLGNLCRGTGYQGEGIVDAVEARVDR
jgi:aerobic-type carbon monoxide dehydrogenase small subunit (CoxS/CutS family)